MIDLADNVYLAWFKSARAPRVLIIESTKDSMKLIKNPDVSSWRESYSQSLPLSKQNTAFLTFFK